MAQSGPINGICLIQEFQPESTFEYCGLLEEDSLILSDLPGRVVFLTDQSPVANVRLILDGDLFLDYIDGIDSLMFLEGHPMGLSITIDEDEFNRLVNSGLNRSHLLTYEVFVMETEDPWVWSAPAVQKIWFHLQDNRELFPDDMSCHIPMILSPVLDSIYMEHPEYLHFQWSTGDTIPSIEVLEEGTYSVTVFTECDTIHDSITIRYDGIEECYKRPFFSQFSNQIRLLEDGEVEVYNALGQKLLGTRERELYLSTPGIYILRFRSVSGAVRTAKIVL